MAHGKWTHRLDFGDFLKSRGERRPITDIDDDKEDVIFSPRITGSYDVNAFAATGRIFVTGLSRRLTGNVRVTVEYRVGGNIVTTTQLSYGAVVGFGLGRIEPTNIPSDDKASNVDAAIKLLNNWRPRVFSFTLLPDLIQGGRAPGSIFRMSAGNIVSFIHGSIRALCLVVRAEINQRGSRPAQLRISMIKLKDLPAAQRGEGTPVFYGSRPVRYVDDIGYVPPPLLQYGGKFIRYASRGVRYD